MPSSSTSNVSVAFVPLIVLLIDAPAGSVIALVDKNTPTVLIATHDGVYDKNLSSLQEVKARGGPVLAVAHEGDSKISGLADAVFSVPKTHELIQPILNVIPLQLFSYHTAVALGRDVDKPRNLAKSVTVE